MLKERGKNSRSASILIPRVQEDDSLAGQLKQRLVDQDEAIEAIVPYVQIFQAGLSPEGRPVGVALLLGPTGTGKTRTVEALAEVLHGSSKNLLKVDCGEFQMEHEVAKLIGAPPGYLGHRETQPMLNQAKVNAVNSEQCGLSLILFDEIEKAAPSMTRLLLGILDKATLRLGDNNTVNFEHSLIFMTTNLGGRSIQRLAKPDFGFESLVSSGESTTARVMDIGVAAVKRKFSPEFVNRIDSIVAYRVLTREGFAQIFKLEIANFRKLIWNRLGIKQPRIELPNEVQEWLIDKGCSVEYGARELKRTIQRHLIVPLAAGLSSGAIPVGSFIRASVNSAGDGLDLMLDAPSKDFFADQDAA